MTRQGKNTLRACRDEQTILPKHVLLYIWADAAAATILREWETLLGYIVAVSESIQHGNISFLSPCHFMMQRREIVCYCTPSSIAQIRRATYTLVVSLSRIAALGFDLRFADISFWFNTCRRALILATPTAVLMIYRRWYSKICLCIIDIFYYELILRCAFEFIRHFHLMIFDISRRDDIRRHLLLLWWCILARLR